jgi:predicted CXXCH cytochrome family protein
MGEGYDGFRARSRLPAHVRRNHVMSSRRRNMLLVLGLAAIAVSAWVVFGLKPWRPASEAPDFPLPPYSETAFLNTGPDATYIGVAACAECHERHHQTYMHTEHSRALAEINLDDEPPDVQFFHEASGRSYRVYRKDNTMRHEEVVRSPEGKEITRVDVPVRYRIGSGSFGRGYLFEVDGFLHQSPITWYPSKKQWGMSPGYDQAMHFAFERPIMHGCLACHAGRVEPVGDAVHRLKLHELAIGCESCHGPGSLHRDWRRAKKVGVGDEDRTIINPGKLSRPLLEAVCSSCHQAAAASVMLRGRAATDLRPGRPITDHRMDYDLDAGKDEMTIVGHMEQMRRSACYQKSSELTCLTCHDPHARAKPKDAVARHRQACLSCHATQGCALDQAERFKRSPADNCVACHMPRGDTEVPHIAFTHHRIGRHPLPLPAKLDRVPELVPVGDVSKVPLLDQQRNLGTAYVLASLNPAHFSYAATFRQRALDILTKVHAAGLRHDETTALLAELHRTSDRGAALAYGRQMLQEKGASADLRAQVQQFVATSAIQDRDFDEAIRLLEQLTTRRRYAEDWRLLGIARLEQDEARQALSAFQQALAIRPTRPAIHLGLAEAQRRLDQAELARQHHEKAQWLIQRNQD